MTRDRATTVLELASLAAIVRGVALISTPAAWIVAGVAGLALSYVLQLPWQGTDAAPEPGSAVAGDPFDEVNGYGS